MSAGLPVRRETIRLKRQLIPVALALTAGLVSLPRAPIERFYSQGLYSALQPLMTGASNLLPFALVDALAIAIALGWLLAVAIDVAWHRSWSTILVRVVVRTIVGAAWLYLAFLFLWGFNYRRVPLVEKLQFAAPGTADKEAAPALLATTIEQVNALHGPAHEHEERTSLGAAFARTERDLGALRFARPGRPKTTLFDWYFRRAGVSGMTDPFFLETVVASDLLPFERPFVIAHEWSHLAGYADEGDANFVGWLTAVRAAPTDRYSGWLFLLEELPSAVREKERTELMNRLGEGPRADLRAIAARVEQQVNPMIAAAGWHAYDKYLRLNSVEEGAASYTRIVQLVLGTKFDADWTPLLR